MNDEHTFKIINNLTKREIIDRVNQVIRGYHYQDTIYNKKTVFVTYDLKVYYCIRSGYTGVTYYPNALDGPALRANVYFIINEDRVDDFEYYQVPICKDSWIFGAIQFGHPHLNGYVGHVVICYRPGAIIITTKMNFIKILLTKNKMILEHVNGTFTKYEVDFTRGFVIPRTGRLHETAASVADYSGEFLCTIASNCAVDIFTKKVRHTYMDMMYPRVFVGFEDINLSTSSDQN